MTVWRSKFRLGIGAMVCILWTSAVVADETIAPADQRFAAASERLASAGGAADSAVAERPDFQRHVVPLLGRLGCNGRSCHGSFQGRGGLQLSLFGYDFQMDHDSLTGSAESERGHRIDRKQADNSLMLRKPLLQTDHEGGRRFADGSWEHHLLRQWIESGAPQRTEPLELAQLEVTPAEIVFRADSPPVRLRVVAVWDDGTREDVTPLCRFRTNDDSIATVDPDGRVQTTGAGDTHVIAFYDNGIVAIPILRPLRETYLAPSPTIDDAQPGIDTLVNAKLQKLGILPSRRSTDTEFLRRVSVDLTGTLPTPAEITEFLTDTSPDKRKRKIDELLERPAYAAWWANKLCDFTGCNPNQQAELGQEISVQWYMWMYQRLRDNMPYHELVQQIVLAQGRTAGQTYPEYAAEMSAYFRDQQPADFTLRETMPHYWTRRSMQDSQEAAQAFAQNFLGIRMQCAQCHKHPFAPWTQHDFTEFARFFGPLKFGIAPDADSQYRQLAAQVGMNVRQAAGEPIRSETLRFARQGKTIPWRELYVAARSQPETISLLRSGSVTLAETDDPRQPIMRWMTDPQNPYFARAIVNRIWAGYFHVGIINPTDDLTPANPPSNPELLQWLTDGFVAQGYDMKWLHRQIASSETYQRSWKPNETNRGDQRNYSRAIPRRIPAEVVYDMVKQSLAATDKQSEVRTDLTRRAIGHLSMRLAGTHAMRVFGKPDRVVNCDCERVNEPTLLQAMYLQNDPLIDQLLESSGWVREIAEHTGEFDSASRHQLIRLAWLRTVNRPPTPTEVERAIKHLDETDSVAEGISDLLWSLMNTKEFILLK